MVESGGETIALDIPMYAVEVTVEAFVHDLVPDSESMALENGKDFRNAWFQLGDVSAASVLVMLTWIKPDRYTESDKRK